MPLQVYSTLTRKKEPFHKTAEESQATPVTMYVCGPTVYKPSHIGHMVGPVIFDTVKRYLTYLGYKVTWVVNITDVDDKLIKRAGELGTTVPELAERMTQDYRDCLKRLNVTGIDQFPKATDHIPGMVRMMQTLIDKGYAYPAGGDVYFDVSKDTDYGKLCNRDPEQLEAGSRVEVSDRKRNPGDFALWKGAKPGEPPEVQYDSPWGKGRPGWHIECSVMAQELLGDTLDIHGGGLDLQFPHHENELAQSESATGKKFAEVWMHNGLLKMGKAKMAGSVGNVVNIADLLQRHTPETVRMLLLSTHYRSPIEYSEERLEEVKRSLQGFYRFFERHERITDKSYYTTVPAASCKQIDLDQFDGGGGWGGGIDNVPIEFSLVQSHTPGRDNLGGGDIYPAGFLLLHSAAMLRERCLDFLDDDFNTGGAVGTLYELLSTLNRYADEKRLDEPQRLPHLVGAFGVASSVLRELSNILGLFWEPPAKASLGGDDKLVGGLMQLLIDVRNDLRADAKSATKDNPLKPALFSHTDTIRRRLAELGVTLEDGPAGTRWRV